MLLGITGWWFGRLPVVRGAARSAQNQTNQQTPFSAELLADERWTNSLGQVFVHVPGTEGLFGVWDVRVKDYAVYAAAVNGGVTNSWQNPGFTQGESHPVVCVSWEDAKAFCGWLTRKERSEGKISYYQSYRLPTDVEWSVAVGLPEEHAGTPAEKTRKITGIYPWGTQWPPPSRAGNFGGEEAKDATWPKGRVTITGYIDGYARTSPVGTFAPNKFGLYDMGGNVKQWCEDWYDEEHANRVLRGTSWEDVFSMWFVSSNRSREAPGHRGINEGFRVVLASDGL